MIQKNIFKILTQRLNFEIYFEFLRLEFSNISQSQMHHRGANIILLMNNPRIPPFRLNQLLRFIIVQLVF